MADVLIGGIIASDVLLFRHKLFPVRGAMVSLSADLTGQNYSVTATAIPFNTEVYDTDTAHDTVTNNTRLTVPSGWSWVRVGATVAITNFTASNYVAACIYKGGAVFVGMPFDERNSTNNNETQLSLSSGPLAVSAADYFELKVILNDSSVSVLADRTSFWLELIA